MIKFRLRFQENFKDGNIARDFSLEKAEFFPGEVIVVDEACRDRMVKSGAVVEEERVVPNPKKVSKDADKQD